MKWGDEDNEDVEADVSTTTRSLGALLENMVHGIQANSPVHN